MQDWYFGKFGSRLRVVHHTNVHASCGSENGEDVQDPVRDKYVCFLCLEKEQLIPIWDQDLPLPLPPLVLPKGQQKLLPRSLLAVKVREQILKDNIFSHDCSVYMMDTITDTME